MANSFKRYYYKVYTAQNQPTYWDVAQWDVDQWDSNPGKLIGVWANDVISDPSFRTVINGGAGELVVDLARKYDNYGEGNDVSLGNKVELWVADNEATNGQRVYTGYISQYTPVIDGDKEYVEVTLMGYVTEMSYRIIKDGSNNTTVTLSGMDPVAMIQQVISYYQLDGGTNLSFNSQTMTPTGASDIYWLKANTMKEAIDGITTLLPYGYNWWVDPSTNDVYVKQTDLNNPTHKIIIGKHATYIQTVKRIESLVNRVFLLGGNNPQLFNEYSRTASIAQYHLAETRVMDTAIVDNTSADAAAKKMLDSSQAPETRSIIRIVDSNGENTLQGYDIESVHVGDSIQVKNISFGAKGLTMWDAAQWDVDVWDQTFQYSNASVMLIVSINYYPGYIEVEASSRQPEVPRRVEDVHKQVVKILNSNTPNSPTVRTV